MKIKRYFVTDLELALQHWTRLLLVRFSSTWKSSYLIVLAAPRLPRKTTCKQQHRHTTEQLSFFTCSTATQFSHSFIWHADILVSEPSVWRGIGIIMSSKHTPVTIQAGYPSGNMCAAQPAGHRNSSICTSSNRKSSPMLMPSFFIHGHGKSLHACASAVSGVSDPAPRQWRQPIGRHFIVQPCGGTP